MSMGTAMGFLSPQDCIRSQDLQDQALCILRVTIFLDPSFPTSSSSSKNQVNRANRLTTAFKQLDRSVSFPPA